MKACLMSIVLIAASATLGFAQTPGQPDGGNQTLQQQLQKSLQPSPGERERCWQKELLNAASRDACRRIGR
jgi:hypothetical protein